jgi:hypothetical protein
MKKYMKSHAKHILLCLIYSVLSCTQQILNVKHHIFYSVYPLFTLYFGMMSVPKIHRLHEYNTVEHTIPKWSYLMRAYYHTVLLDEIPFAGIVSVLLLLIVMMWKESRFLISHAETRLRKIDEQLYNHEATRKYRVCHLHLNAFDDDVTSRTHLHQFNTNMLDIVPHSYQSEENQNAIKNYVEHRKRNMFAPKQMTDWEKKMWRVSEYRDIFIQNREVSMFAPIIYILCGAFVCFPMAESNRLRLLVYLNTLIFIGDGISTVTMARLNNDVFIDLLYMFVSIVFICLSSYNGQ